MKYVNCPTCEWTLGVPGKLLGSSVQCPKCENDFVAQDEQGTDEKPPKKKRLKSAPKLAPRALPTPPTIAKSNKPNKKNRSASTESPSSLAAPPNENPPVPAPPKRKNRLRSPSRTKSESAFTPPNNGNRLVSPVQSEPIESVQQESQTPPSEQQQVVARIIDSEPEVQELGADGKLPTLQLKEENKKKIDTAELKKKPIFLGIIVCLSVLSSGLMLFFADLSPKTDEAVLNQARQDIRRFYSVREDIQLQTFQLELREAQLAHSRNDRPGEIAAYRKVMTRFRAEDKSKFVGVTGSPGADIELEKLVSILLGDGKGN
jgi:hypothetical protein